MLQKNKEISVRMIEAKVNTNFKTTQRQVNDLESLGFLKIVEKEAHPKNNKPYKICRITNAGLKWINENK